MEVAQRLTKRLYPENVQVVDFDIRGIDLAYTPLEDYNTLVMVDTVSGDWVLIHAGFAMSKIDEVEAQETIKALNIMGDV